MPNALTNQVEIAAEDLAALERATGGVALAGGDGTVAVMTGGESLDEMRTLLAARGYGLPGVSPGLPSAAAQEQAWPVSYSNLVRNPMTVGAMERDRARAQRRVSANEFYPLYHQRLRVIQAYRDANLDFDRLGFTDLLRGAITEAEVVVQRPEQMVDEEDYQALCRSLAPPFEWFNERVNQHLMAKNGGAEEVAYWLLNHLLEGGVAGWLLTFGTRAINGVQYRVPIECHIYGGERLACDQGFSTFADERWFIKLREDEPLAGPNLADPTRYYQLLNRPDEWIYCGVAKMGHAAGGGTYYPRPPYFSLLDALLACEMMLRDDLSSLAHNERTLTVWTFDTTRMKAAGIQWRDVQIAGTTEVVQGAISAFKAERERLIAMGSQGGAEMAVMDYVTYAQYHPNLELLKSLDKYRPYHAQIHLAAGILYDYDGNEMAQQSQMRGEIDFDFIREQCLEPTFNAIYQCIANENRRYFGLLNGLGQDYDPYTWTSKTAQRKLPEPKDLVGRQKRAEKLVKLRLDGHVVELGVECEFAPCASRNPETKKEIRAGQMRGQFTTETLHRTFGLDPKLERARMYREKADYYQEQKRPGQALFSAPVSYTQQVVSPDGQVVQTRGEVSKGRPPGSPDGPDVNNIPSQGASAPHTQSD